MRILKEISRRYKDKEYYKYKVNIPCKSLCDAELKEKDNSDITVKKCQITLKKINPLGS